MVRVWLVFLAIAVVYASLTADECLSKGFESATLFCSTCETLKGVLGETGAAENYYSECRDCCMPDPTEEMYSFALYQADRRFVKAKDGLMDTLNELRAKFKGHISVKHRSGTRPTLRLFHQKDDEEAAMTESVWGWEREALVEFLNEHLRLPAVSVDEALKEAEVSVDGQ